MTDKLTKQELKIIAKTGKFRERLLKIFDDAKVGKVNDKDELSYYMISSIADLIKYCNLVCSCKFKKAANLDMDSSVRDAIPEKIFDFVDNYYNYEYVSLPAVIKINNYDNRNTLSFTEWKNKIIDLLLVKKYAVSKQKAKHYLWEAESVADANMGLRECYNVGYTTTMYLKKGIEEGFWAHYE